MAAKMEFRKQEKVIVMKMDPYSGEWNERQIQIFLI